MSSSSRPQALLPPSSRDDVLSGVRGLFFAPSDGVPVLAALPLRYQTEWDRCGGRDLGTSV